MALKSKNILVCVSGLTPQIITETFFCLTVKQKIQIDELYILTTRRGKEVILGIDQAQNTPKSSLKKELQNLCNDYKVKFPLFELNDNHIITAKEESIELYDVRTDKDNILFPNKVMDFIRRLTMDQNTILHCSISGGRKTMSVHLAFALSIFGREKDKLYHVLTSEENEFKDFYPKTKKDEKLLELSEIPYVRLRTILSKELQEDSLLRYSYDQIVSATQKSLRILLDQNVLILNISNREIQYNVNRIRLEPMELAIYHQLIQEKLNNNDKLTIQEITSLEFGKKIFDFIETNYKYFYLTSDRKEKLIKTGISSELFRSKRSIINKKIFTLFNHESLANLFIIQSQRIYGNSRYFVSAPKEKIKIVS